MKRLFKGINKRTILNFLGVLTVSISREPLGASAWLYYEPDKPELLGKVTKEELLGTKK